MLTPNNGISQKETRLDLGFRGSLCSVCAHLFGQAAAAAAAGELKKDGKLHRRMAAPLVRDYTTF